MTDAPDLVLRYGAHADQCIDLWYGDRRANERALIVLLHGGFWRPVHDRSHMQPMALALARTGWSIANVEYRRAPGDPDLTLHDVTAALTCLAAPARDVSNDGRRVVAGFSAGGHLALWLAATCQRDLLVGALGLAPVADLRCAERLNLGDGALDLFLGTHCARRNALDPAQLPMPTRPVVIVHGECDDTVPIAVSESYVSAHPAVPLRRVPAAGHFDLIDPHSKAWPAVTDELARLAGRRLR